VSQDDQIRWDRQHLGSHGAEQPSSFLRQVFESGAWELPAGRALDLACGQGRNALYLAERGFEVVAMDISTIALEEGRRRAEEKQLRINWEHSDLEQTQLAGAAFDLIVNFNYLQRSLIAQMKAALKNGGHMIFETYLIDQRTIGQPKNPDYLLGHNELLDWFRDFRVLSYREGKFIEGKESSFRAGLFARKADGVNIPRLTPID
jgi:SAM-dependent methyltransferase